MAYLNSDVLVFEADIKKLESPEVSQQIITKAMYSDERTLQNVLSEDVYKELEKISLSLNIPLTNMSKFKPSMVVLTLTILKMQKMGMAVEGIDQHFYSKAIEDDKSLLFLETVEEQVDLIITMGEGNEDEFVLHSIEDFESMEKEMEELILTWRDGSARSMKKQLSTMKKKYPELYQSMLVQRNKNWMPLIESYFQNAPIELIIVGALHLHGSDGIIDMCKKKGYTIEQVEL